MGKAIAGKTGFQKKNATAASAAEEEVEMPPSPTKITRSATKAAKAHQKPGGTTAPKSNTKSLPKSNLKPWRAERFSEEGYHDRPRRRNLNSSSDSKYHEAGYQSY